MSDDQFTELFKYVKDQFDIVNEKLDEKSSQTSLDRLTNTIDSFIKRLDTNDIEAKSRDLQFERLLDWAREVSRKTGIPLKNL